MRAFDYIKEPEKLLTPEIVQMIGKIHEHKGKQELFLEANIDELKTLLEVALIQSTGASNRIEGIYTTDKRLEELVSQKAEPRNRSEQEISGYREVLSTIHESYEYIVPRPNIILQLHRDLYSYAGSGGEYKNADNVIAETDAEGHQKARFIPVPAFQTAEAMDELCRQFLEASTMYVNTPPPIASTMYSIFFFSAMSRIPHITQIDSKFIFTSTVPQANSISLCTISCLISFGKQSSPPDVKSWTTFFTNKFEKSQKNKPYKVFSRFRTDLSLVGLNCFLYMILS